MAWNRPKEGPDTAVRAHRGTGRAFPGWLVAALAAGAGVLAWWLWPEGDGRLEPSAQDRPARSAIRRVTPAKVAKPVEVAEGPKETVRATAAKEEAPTVATQRVVQAHVTTNAEVLAIMERFKREPARGRAEQLLLMVAPCKKGARLPPPPIGGPGDIRLEKEAEEVLERVGKVEEWDTEQSIAVKEELERLKDEWYEAKRNGRSFHAFLQSKIDAADHDADVLETTRKFDRENYEDKSMSDADYEKAHEKVNKLLEMQGFEKIRRPDAEEEDDN